MESLVLVRFFMFYVKLYLKVRVRNYYETNR
jgi:hypothetical protein